MVSTRRDFLSLLLTSLFTPLNSLSLERSNLTLDNLLLQTERELASFGLEDDEFYIIVRGRKQQLLTSISGSGRVVASYLVSTGKRGFGNGRGSGQTPLGALRVYQKVGESLPLYTRFVHLQPRGLVSPDDRRHPYILSRVLCLEGLEDRNSNTRSRGVFIHGTNFEDLLGRPVSGGCIRMRNSDVKRLFDSTPIGTLVYVSLD